MRQVLFVCHGNICRRRKKAFNAQHLWGMHHVFDTTLTPFFEWLEQATPMHDLTPRHYPANACKVLSGFANWAKSTPPQSGAFFVSATRGQIIYRAVWESNAFSSHSRPITPGGFLYDIYCLETGCLCKWRKSSRRFQRWCSCQKSCHVIFLWWIFKKINTGGSCTFAAKFCQRDIPLLVTM